MGELVEILSYDQGWRDGYAQGRHEGWDAGYERGRVDAEIVEGWHGKAVTSD